MSQETEEPTASIINALLYPAAKYLGEELRSKLESVIEERRNTKEAKHKENLSKHVNAVIERNINSGHKSSSVQTVREQELSIMQLTYIPEWVDGSQKIDPENEEEKTLAQLWQDILFGITAGYKYEDSLINVLSKLREQEAKLLTIFISVNIYFVKSSEYKDKARFEELNLFGLVKNPAYMTLIKNWVFIKKSIFSAFLALLLSLITCAGLFFIQVQFIAIISLASVFCVLYTHLLQNIKRSSWELTKKGKQLLAFCPAR